MYCSSSRQYQVFDVHIFENVKGPAVPGVGLRGRNIGLTSVGSRLA